MQKSEKKPMADQSFRKEFGVRLKQIRKAKGWTQKELAMEIDSDLSVTHALINKYESGQGFPPPEKLMSIAHALNASLDFLLTGDTPDSQPLTNQRLLKRFVTLDHFNAQDQETVIAVIDALVAKQHVREHMEKALNPFDG